MAIKNMAASVLTRLKNQSKEEGIPFQMVLQLFAQEEFLRKLSLSQYADNPQLIGYVKRLHRELAEQGIPFDKKRFSPHITLIRKYSCRGGREIPVSDTPNESMVATRVSLMRSERGKNGMIYTEIGSIGE